MEVNREAIRFLTKSLLLSTIVLNDTSATEESEKCVEDSTAKCF